MARLAARGIEIDLPAGWDGRIQRRQTAPAEARTTRGDAVAVAPPALVQAATRSLPTGIGDYGSGVVELLRNDDLFLSLIEFEADSLGSALFAARPQPRRLLARDFEPTALQRVLPGQAGAQVFFTAADRPFCLYVVLGSYLRRARMVPILNGVLEGVQIT
jgi:hypothetical protein